MADIYKVFEYSLKEAIKICSKISDSSNEYILQCEGSFKNLLKVIEKNERLNRKFQKYEFFEVFFFVVFMNFTPYRFIMKNQKISEEDRDTSDFAKRMATIIDMYHSLLKKYMTVIQLANAELYESAIILFRSLYEGMVITKFLLENNTEDRLNSFQYLSAKRYWKAFNVKGSGFYQMAQYLFEQNKSFLERTEHDRNDSKYGWTGIKNVKEDIKFEDILMEVYSGERQNKMLKFFKVMYRVASEAIHSNCLNILTNPKTLEFFVCYSLDNFILEELQYIGKGIIENKYSTEKNIICKIYDMAYSKYFGESTDNTSHNIQPDVSAMNLTLLII